MNADTGLNADLDGRLRFLESVVKGTPGSWENIYQAR